MATVPILLEAVSPSLRTSGDILFDLSGLSFMDTTGLHSILAIAAPLTTGSILLVAPRPPVRRLLTIMGIDGHERIDVLETRAGLAEQAS